jgi:transposase-like protein
MSCPRCHNLLHFIYDSPLWKSHFVCHDCLSAWTVFSEQKILPNPYDLRKKKRKTVSTLILGRELRAA